MRSALAAAVLGCLLVSACDRDDDDAPRNVPADIRPEDATFRYRSRSGGQQLLEIRLSTISFCTRDLPDKHTFVGVGVFVPNAETIVPDTYPIETTGNRGAEVSLTDLSGAGCSGAAGLGSRFGSVTLTEITPTTVRGTYEGTNPDTRLALRGSFVATACPDQSTICGL